MTQSKIKITLKRDLINEYWIKFGKYLIKIYDVSNLTVISMYI